MRILSVLCVCAAAATSARASDDARDLLKSAAEACRGLAAVRYTVVQKMGDQTTTATIVQQQADVKPTGIAGRYCAQGGTERPGGPSQPFAWSYDGLALRVLDHSGGFVAVIDNPDASDAGRFLGVSGMVAFAPFLDGAGLQRVLDRAESLELQPPEEIGGVRCDVVRVRQSFVRPDNQQKVTSTSTWGIGQADHLPRMLQTPAGRCEITRLETNPELKPDDLTF